MAQLLTCKICLLSFDGSDRQVQVADDVDDPFKTLSFKLLSLGFFQGGFERLVPCHLCSWCASRVEDSYDLQQQCLKSSQALMQAQDGALDSVKGSPPVETLLERVASMDIETLPKLTKHILPGLIQISRKNSSNARTVSNVVAGAHDMFICIRNLSSALRLNTSLLTNAVQFTENILSFITVLLSLNEDTAAMKKSAETMKKEAVMWKVKSAMLSDSTSFVECVSPINVISNKRDPTPPKEIQKNIEKSPQNGELNKDGKDVYQDEEEVHQDEEEVHQDEEEVHRDEEEVHQNEEDLHQGEGEDHHEQEEVHQDEEELQQDGEKPQQQLHQNRKDLEAGVGEPQDYVTTVPSDSSKIISEFSPLGQCVRNNIIFNTGESGDITDSANPEEQTVRRSLRNRSMVDTLVYWPKFKKQAPTSAKLEIPQSQPSSAPIMSSQALDRLLLRRDVDPESDAGNNDMWAIVASSDEQRVLRKRPEIQTQPAIRKPSVLEVEGKMGIDRKKIKIEDDAGNVYVTLSKSDENGLNNNAEVSCAGNENNCDNVKQQLDVTNHEKPCSKPKLKSAIRAKVTSPKSPCSCKICGKTLRCSRNLQAHMNMHTGSSPYQCNYCHKLFTSSWNRAQHERVHTGLKPYKCDICKESFRYNVSLRHHKSKVHDV